MEEQAARERERTARTARYPDLEVGLRGGFVGQPVVFRHGLTDAYRPDAPDWSQNYAVDLAQPLYQGDVSATPSARPTSKSGSRCSGHRATAPR